MNISGNLLSHEIISLKIVDDLFCSAISMNYSVFAQVSIIVGNIAKLRSKVLVTLTYGWLYRHVMYLSKISNTPRMLEILTAMYSNSDLLPAEFMFSESTAHRDNLFTLRYLEATHGSESSKHIDESTTKYCEMLPTLY